MIITASVYQLDNHLKKKPKNQIKQNPPPTKSKPNVFVEEEQIHDTYKTCY